MSRWSFSHRQSFPIAYYFVCSVFYILLVYLQRFICTFAANLIQFVTIRYCLRYSLCWQWCPFWATVHNNRRGYKAPNESDPKIVKVIPRRSCGVSTEMLRVSTVKMRVSTEKLHICTEKRLSVTEQRQYSTEKFDFHGITTHLYGEGASLYEEGLARMGHRIIRYIWHIP